MAVRDGVSAELIINYALTATIPIPITASVMIYRRMAGDARRNLGLYVSTRENGTSGRCMNALVARANGWS